MEKQDKKTVFPQLVWPLDYSPIFVFPFLFSRGFGNDLINLD